MPASGIARADASMFCDLDRGRRMELDEISGLIVQVGAELGVPTPVHRTLYAVLKPCKDGRHA
jgi:2-dehydropantoate 2-reductase